MYYFYSSEGKIVKSNRRSKGWSQNPKDSKSASKSNTFGFEFIHVYHPRTSHFLGVLPDGLISSATSDSNNNSKLIRHLLTILSSTYIVCSVCKYVLYVIYFLSSISSHSVSFCSNLFHQNNYV